MIIKNRGYKTMIKKQGGNFIMRSYKRLETEKNYCETNMRYSSNFSCDTTSNKLVEMMQL